MALVGLIHVCQRSVTRSSDLHALKLQDVCQRFRWLSLLTHVGVDVRSRCNLNGKCSQRDIRGGEANV